MKSNTLKYRFFFLALSVVMVHALNAQLVPIATPVQLQPEQTQFFSSDYETGDPCISHVEWPDGLSEMEHDTAHFVTLTGSLSAPLALASVYCDNEVFSIVVKRSEKQPHNFRIPESKLNGKKVSVFGAFNAWNREATPMQLKDGFWTATVYVNPGKHEYLLAVDGKEQLDPMQRAKVSNGSGGFNSVLAIQGPKNLPQPIQTVSHTATYLDVAALPANQQIWAIWNNRLLSNHITRDDSRIRIAIPKEAQQEQRSFLRLFTFNEEAAALEVRVPLHFGKVLTAVHQLNRSDWEASVLYSVLIDRFANGSEENDWQLQSDEVDPRVDYYGGDIAGMRQVMENNYFQDLGVNALWLSPITQNPYGAYGYWDKGGVTTKFTGYHGYWPISNIKPDPRFATPDELHTFLGNAHRNGLNVILDYVANHVHQEHPVYQSYPEWATELYLPDGTLNTERWDDHRLTTWFDTFMPTLDLRRQEIVDVMTDSALVWISEYDFDGFRHDATKHIDEKFWRTLTQKARALRSGAENPRLYQIGETYGSPELIGSYVSSGMLDAQFDFNLYDAAVATFGVANATFERLHETLSASLQQYGQHHVMGNITGNHDRPRFISLAAGDVRFDEDAKLAGWTRDILAPKASTPYQQLLLLHAFNVAVPGVPTIYYGDEYGEPGANDPDNRRWMRFDGHTENEALLLSAVQELLQLRTKEAALIYGTTTTETLNKGKTLKISRHYFNETIVIYLHVAKAKTKIPTAGEVLFASNVSKKKNTTKKQSYTTKPYSVLIVKEVVGNK